MIRYEGRHVVVVCSACTVSSEERNIPRGSLDISTPGYHATLNPKGIRPLTARYCMQRCRYSTYSTVQYQTNIYRQDRVKTICRDSTRPRTNGRPGVVGNRNSVLWLPKTSSICKVNTDASGQFQTASAPFACREWNPTQSDRIYDHTLVSSIINLVDRSTVVSRQWLSRLSCVRENTSDDHIYVYLLGDLSNNREFQKSACNLGSATSKF